VTLRSRRLACGQLDSLLIHAREGALERRNLVYQPFDVRRGLGLQFWQSFVEHTEVKQAFLCQLYCAMQHKLLVQLPLGQLLINTLIDFELPYALRYTEHSTAPEDSGASLVLVRLATAAQSFVGYAAVNVDSGSTTLHPFEPLHVEPHMCIWAEQSQQLVAASFADAVALNHRYHCPVVVVSTPASLQAFSPKAQLGLLVYALPRGLGDEWHMALAVANSKGHADKVTCIEPAGADHQLTWAQYLCDLPRSAKVHKRDIPLGRPEPSALDELMSVSD
jgi:hypothetical protein